MKTNRLEAFSDGVIAILITIMVLELRIPDGGDWSELRPMLPAFLTYVLSFVFLGIYWNNHHHMLYVAERITGRILWANLHLLFWLSLIPFATGWMGHNSLAEVPTAVYGGVLLMAALAWLILQTLLVAEQGPNSKLARAVAGDVKGKISTTAYVVAIPLAFANSWISVGLYVFVALLWLVPHREMEAKAKGS